MLPDKKINQILREQKLAPRKRFGQNFLTNGNIAEKIVRLAGIEPDDTILEVGVGFGALTGRLAPRCKKVIGLEVDSGIVRYHEEEETLPANVLIGPATSLRHTLTEEPPVAMCSPSGERMMQSHTT